ncbi:helix-turn-helix domain-containing protein [Nocardia sp. CA-107356]|uniref:helix-turn-helix domain-containing protein n=1 Tax=Nocardia sp. CA-107356 TaxID=3239972 RepID=UPI003D937C82
MTSVRPDVADGEPVSDNDAIGLPVLYSPEAVAQALGLPSANWLEEAARQKRIPHTRIGRRLRFTRDQVDLAIQLYTIPQDTSEQHTQVRQRRTTATQKAQSRRLQARIPARMRKSALSQGHAAAGGEANL